MGDKIIDYLNMYFEEVKKEENIDFNEGVCLGCALKAIEAFCLGSEPWEQHQNRLKEIQRSTFTSKEEIPLELQGYLQKIAVLQDASKYRKLFPDQTTPMQGNNTLSAMIAQSQLAEEQGGIQEVYSFSGAYNLEEIRAYLYSYIKAVELNKEARCALLLESHDHAIMLAYDAESKMWFIDNHGVINAICDTKTTLVVSKLLAAFENNLPFSNPLIIKTIVYSTDNCLIEVDKAIKLWRKSKSWKEIHKVTEDKTKLVSMPGNISWLFLAAQNGHAKTVKNLLKKGADIRALSGVNKKTPLQIAASKGHIGVIKLLLKQGADIDAASNLTALHSAALNGQLAAVKFLINKQANIEALAKYNITPLHSAVESKNLRVVKFLLDKGAKVDAFALDKYTPLHFAVENGDLPMVKLLLENGANINALTIYNETPLHLAGKNNQPEIFELLLARKAHIDRSINGYLPSQLENQAKFIRLLIDFRQHRAKPKTDNNYLFFTRISL